MGCYSTTKKEGILLFAAVWMDPDNVALSAISQGKTNATQPSSVESNEQTELMSRVESDLWMENR